MLDTKNIKVLIDPEYAGIQYDIILTVDDADNIALVAVWEDDVPIQIERDTLLASMLEDCIYNGDYTGDMVFDDEIDYKYAEMGCS